MKTLEPLLGLAPGLQAAAKADTGGNVNEVVGTIDGESVCAMASMCNKPLDRVGGLLGMGDLTSWTFVNKRRTYYTARAADGGIVTVTGEVSKNPEAVLKKIAKTASERWGW